MQQSTHLNWIANFIWGIADDVLRDIYVRGKYRDVILPMVVIRRLDAVLEATKADVLAMKERLDSAGITNQDGALKQASGQAFYNASQFTLRDLRNRSTQQRLQQDFEAYLDGFSSNVQEVLDKFKFRNQMATLVEADILGALIEKYLDPQINLSPDPVLNGDGSVHLPGLDNHAMGTLFEELIRRFNEENNEEAGEHFTPRDVVRLMAKVIFQPVAEQISSGTYLVYDGACGTGGMLTIAEETLAELAAQHDYAVSTHLYGQEINPETYAITKADLLLKGEGQEAETMAFGSTLSNDFFPSTDFDFMLSNPPYGKSWKTDLEKMGGKKEMRDPRFIINYDDDPDYSLITRSSDGQLMFLVNMLSKMKQDTALGSRIAEVHNGSSLFTGNAGQGESNIRRWIIENDWLEAIIALPLNMFYNTGIATYIWVLSNRKPAHRVGKVQLIDATEWYAPLRKNLGNKNCELSEAHIDQIMAVFMAFEETEQSKLFENAAFGYHHVTVERPLRLRVDLDETHLDKLRELCAKSKDGTLPTLIADVAHDIGADTLRDYNAFMRPVKVLAKLRGERWTAKREKLLREALTTVDADAAPVIKRLSNPGKLTADPLHGAFPVQAKGRPMIAQYEADSSLRDTEQIPLLEAGGIEGFFQREVLPYVDDAWIDASKIKIGHEISFNRYFYKPEPLRTLEDIRADIDALERETDGLLGQILVKTGIERYRNTGK